MSNDISSTHIEFNPNKDKITERELVYDILNRVSFGEDIKGHELNLSGFNNDTIFTPKKLTDVIAQMNLTIKHTLANKIDKIYFIPINITGEWIISNNYSNFNRSMSYYKENILIPLIAFSDFETSNIDILSQYFKFYAYSEKTELNVTELFKIKNIYIDNSNNLKYLNLEYDIDIPYNNDDTIMFFYWHE